MEVAKIIFMLYLEVCATVCTVEVICFGLGKVDKYITKRRKAKQEANKPVEKEEPKYSKELDELRSKVELERFKRMIQEDSREYREQAKEFIENSKRFQEDCQRLLAENDKHIEALIKMNEKEGAK